MKLQHTPGPWISIINNYCSADFKGCFVLADGVKIAEVSARNINSQTICEANAHLIAAAPEMLDALIKTLKRGMNGLEQTRDEAIKIKNIIESATGLTIEEVLK